MVLLKHRDFEFKNILSGGYKLLEDASKVLSEVTMSNGSVRRNYEEMPKTTIKVLFGRLNKDTYTEYISHFQENEDEYTYFSFKHQAYLTKKFFITLPETVLLHINEHNQKYDEFEVVLEQCNELEDGEV